MATTTIREQLDAAESNLAAWDAMHGATLAELQHAEREANAASETARSEFLAAGHEARERLRIKQGKDFHPDFIAALESIVGFPWAERDRLKAANAASYRDDPMELLANAISKRLVDADPIVKAASARADEASARSTAAWRARNDCERRRTDLASIVRDLRGQVADEEARAKAREERKANGNGKSVEEAERERAWKETEKKIKAARKVCAEFKPETFVWPSK